VFDLKTGKPLAVLEGHQSFVSSVAVAQVGGKDVVVSGGYDKTIRAITYDATFNSWGKLYIVHNTAAAVALQPDVERGDLLVSASPGAWRDWFAEYRVGDSLHMTDIDDVPRAI
jgi:WD40 repeat protein